MRKATTIAPTETMDTMLRELRLSHLALTYPTIAAKATAEGWTHDAFLTEVMRQEYEHRLGQRVEHRLRDAGLPPEKTFRTLDLTRFSPALLLSLERLKTASFVDEAMNVVTIGRPGVGKSHIAAALGDEIVRHGHPVLWTTSARLVQRLLVAKRDLCLPKEIAKLDHFACLILDDIGYVQYDRDEMEVLFTLFAERYERRSMIITTNLAFSDWDRIFKDPMTTLAAIDRVVHHSVILDLMTAESYRAHQAIVAQDADRALQRPQTGAS